MIMIKMKYQAHIEFNMSKRLRKLKMKQIKVTALLMIMASLVAILLIYYLNWPIQRIAISSSTKDYVASLPMVHVPLRQIYNDFSNESSEIFYERRQEQMLDTPGCKIPMAMVNYFQYLNNSKSKHSSCSKRGIFLYKTGVDKIRVYIKNNIMKRHTKRFEDFKCCYRFLLVPKKLIYERMKLRYTNCKTLYHGLILDLETDFINVKCFQNISNNVSQEIYEDWFAFIKKINKTKVLRKDCQHNYNVLMIGLDSMSLPRLAQTMTRTIDHLYENFWLLFKGYHKVEDNTFPNLMAVLTGKNLTAITNLCTNRMDRCNELMIWSDFKRDGYITAYGEDYLRLPDTFTNRYAYNNSPTDHYLRPFFLQGEVDKFNKSLVCSGKEASGKHLLDYALDFANTYKREKFFGLFWMNSFSHNTNSRPQDADKMFEDFFNKLKYTGALFNTFVIFFSDHGIRFGEHRWRTNAYYDDRMPFLYMSVPNVFAEKLPLKLNNLAINQNRLITPYDLYSTLVEIKNISGCRNHTKTLPEGCPGCQSLFEIVTENRTCSNVNIHEKWCSCHDLNPLPPNDKEGNKSAVIAVTHINNMIKAIETMPCWGCMKLSLRNIIRIHFYYSRAKENLYYVVAFAVTPGNVLYEATIERNNKTMDVIGPISIISPYRGLGKCTFKFKDRLFCMCQKKENAENN